MKNTSLITITEKDGKRAVSARELHQFLESRQEFAHWIKNRINEYGFIENQDFEVFDKFIKNPNGGRPLTEYVISIDMAKELSMVEKSEKGKQARRYFIEMEKKAKKIKDTLALETNEDAKYFELTTLIRKYLQRGDIKDVADITGYSQKTLGLVLKGMKTKPHFIQALYKRALDNKKSGRIIGVQLMIENLKCNNQ